MSTAVDLADREGIDALSMRSLAQELGVVPMAIYKHVAHKEELLQRMVDLVFEELEFHAQADWKAALRERAIDMREALIRHPWALGLIDSGTPGPANLRHQDAVFACLRVQAGLSFPSALHAYSLVDSYIFGYAYQQKTLPKDIGGSAQATLKRIAEQWPASATAFPHITELLTEVGRSGYDYDAEFRFGLDLLLDGIDRIRQQEKPPVA